MQEQRQELTPVSEIDNFYDYRYWEVDHYYDYLMQKQEGEEDAITIHGSPEVIDQLRKFFAADHMGRATVRLEVRFSQNGMKYQYHLVPLVDTGSGYIRQEIPWEGHK